MNRLRLIKRFLPDNVQRAGAKLYARGRLARKGIPQTISFEVTTKCNASCIICARQDVETIPSRDVDPLIIRKVVEEPALAGARTVFALTGLAEPLLYKDLAWAVRFIKERIPAATVGTTTNGIALSGDCSRELIEAGLDRIMISVNAASRETYRWLCGVDKYEQVVTNLLDLLSLRKSLSPGRPLIRVDFKITERTRDEIRGAMQSWREKMLSEDEIVATDIISYRKGPHGGAEHGRGPKVRRYPCIDLWSMAKIDVDGNIYPCCGKVLHPDYRTKSELYLGNIHETTLSEVFGGGRIGELRMLHLEGRAAALPTCAVCDAYKTKQNLWFHNTFIRSLNREWI